MVLSEKEKLLSEEKTIAQDQTQNLSAQLKQKRESQDESICLGGLHPSSGGCFFRQ